MSESSENRRHSTSNCAPTSTHDRHLVHVLYMHQRHLRNKQECIECTTYTHCISHQCRCGHWHTDNAHKTHAIFSSVKLQRLFVRQRLLERPIVFLVCYIDHSRLGRTIVEQHERAPLTLATATRLSTICMHISNRSSVGLLL